MFYTSVNPVTNQVLRSFLFDAFPDLSKSQTAYNHWRKLPIAERKQYMDRVAGLLERDKEKYARLITLEMGKPLREAVYEIEKVLTAFNYYIANAEKLLSPELVATKAAKSYVSFEPLGIIFSVMPWNFPFWQVFRFAVPALIAGNVTILKHAPNVCQCALAIAELFTEAGLPNGVFKNYFLTNEDAAKLIADDRIAGVSFTGSDATGSILAGLAGTHIKKIVVELGGNDAFIVLPDADLAKTVAGAIKSRSINSGQSCNAAKRFIVVESIAEAFVEKLSAAVHQLKVGDPMDAATQIGPLARLDLAEKVRRQIQQTIAEGAIPLYHHFQNEAQGNFVAPIVLTNVLPDMTAFKEEIFGPVWSVIVAKDTAHAVELANQSQYGLGASIWTQDLEQAMAMIPELQAGNVFINEIVKSDASLPFGGIKKSGFGRELSGYGLKEFVNIKTVFIA